ncbi:MAG TPA: DUF2207 domain-containing protein [Patescibacteria group bacterium]|nr:DUF2207 domain-containing protein [Patescibacteria group bacterium]
MFIKKRKIWFIALLVVFSCVFIGNKIILADSQEIIRDFRSTIVVNQDSSIEIKEAITYDFGLNLRHGIFRSVPYQYPLEDKTLVLDYKVESVQNEKGENIPYILYTEGNNFVLKIGSADKSVSGQRTYIISYIIKGAVNYFSDYDELFWNVTGNDWQIPIEYSGADFVLNDSFSGLSIEDFKTVCYTGALGSKKENCQIDKSSSARVIRTEAYNLKSKDGLTIVIGWPKGFVKEISKEYIANAGINNASLKNENIPQVVEIWSIIRYIFLSFPLIIFLVLFSIWWRTGRNPRAMRVIMAEYKAPSDISPAEAHIIVTEGAVKMGKMATATLIDLARRGYFIIKEQAKKILIFQSTDWKFIKTNKQNSSDVLNEYEKYLLETIFKDGDEVLLSGLKKVSSFTQYRKLKKNLEAVTRSLGNGLINKNLIPKNPFTLSKKMEKWQFIVSVIFLFIGLVFVYLIVSSGVSEIEKFIPDIVFIFIGYAFISIIFRIFIYIMPSLTDRGLEMKEKLKGFELFLKTVERDRVKFHFSPEAHPEKFADYLPYAILFGVEKQWAKLFKNISIATPQWYQGKDEININSVYIASNIFSMNSEMDSSFFASGSSAAGGSSGFGGGSGGGFGGGGGGSW